MFIAAWVAGSGPVAAGGWTGARTPGEASAVTTDAADCGAAAIDARARCLSLSVPLDRGRPNGPAITLRALWVPAAGPERVASEPVVWIAGGPGQSAIDQAAHWVRQLEGLRVRHDLLFPDQRGTGRSAPLYCPGDDPTDAAAQTLADALDTPAQVRAVLDCRARLERLAWGDLRHFGTAAAVADLAAWRRALGADRLHLMATSYGTRVALHHALRHRSGVGRMVLDGVMPTAVSLPEAAARSGEAAWQALILRCRAAPSCQRRHPALAQDWARALRRLPARVALRHPETGQTEWVRLTADGLRASRRAALYLPSLSDALPDAVAEAARGRFQALIDLNMSLSAGVGRIASGMHFSVVCAEDRVDPRQAAASVVDRASAPPGAAAGALGASAASGVPGAPRASDTRPGLHLRASVADSLAGSEAAGGAAVQGAWSQDPVLKLYARVCAQWPQGEALPRWPAGGAVDAPSPGRGAGLPPVWLLSGGRDPVTPPHHAQGLMPGLGSSSWHSVRPTGGHGQLVDGCVARAAVRFMLAEDAAAAAAVVGAAPCGLRPSQVSVAGGVGDPDAPLGSGMHGTR